MAVLGSTHFVVTILDVILMSATSLNVLVIVDMEFGHIRMDESRLPKLDFQYKLDGKRNVTSLRHRWKI